MKIGVDAGALGVSDERLKVGVYRVIVNLLQELGKLDTKNEYFLYSFDPIDRGLMSSFGYTMENKVLWPVKGWFTLRLPLELKLRPVDVFLGVSQAIPRSPSRTRTIGFIYDVGFLHHPDAYPGSFQKLKRQTERLLKLADRIITISEFVKRDVMKTYNIAADALTVNYPGIDAQFSRDGDAFKGIHPYFLFVGALKVGKNIPSILAAFSKFLAREKTSYDLYLVGGDFWKDKTIEQTINRFRLERRVRLLGYVPDTEVAQYYRGAVALVSPSLHEGFCLPAIEAMASGCPVIGSTAGAMPEIVGDAGILVDPADVDDLSKALEIIAHNATRRRTLVKKGLLRSKRFSWETFAKTVYRIIQSAHET